MTTISWQHRALVRGLRLTGAKKHFTAARVHDTVAKLRARTDQARPTGRAVRGLEVERQELVGYPVWTLRRGSGVSKDVVVGIHGGAYVGEIGWSHWWAYADVVRGTGATLMAPIYPLAPVGTAGAVVPRMADLLEAVIAAHGSEQVGVIGDSAGAGLAMAALQELVRRGSSTPARLVLISPWLDATVSDPASLHIDDPMLDAEGLAMCGRMWAGELDPADPRVSPMFGSLSGLPPTLVLAGTLDLLHLDALRLQQRAQEEGADITVEIREGLLHSWAGLPFLPEARAVRPRLLSALVGT